MRRTGLFVGCLLVACTGESGPEVSRLEQSVVVYKQTLKGGSAYASFGSELVNGYVNINKQGTGKAAQAFLDFGLSQADPTSQVCEPVPFPPPPPPPEPVPPKLMDVEYCYFTRYIEEYGYGTVPAADVQMAKNGAAVSTTVALGPEFWITRCTIDHMTGVYDCVDGTGGTIAVTWASDGWSYSKRTGTDEYGYQTFAYRTSGIMTSYSATAEGTLIGNTFTDSYGSLYSSNGVSREIIKKQIP